MCSLSFLFAAQMEDRRKRNCCIQSRIARKDPSDHCRHRRGKQFVEEQEKCISVPYCGKSENGPQDCILQTDISVKIPFLIRIIPPFAAVDQLEEFAGKPFDDSGLYSASDKQKNRIVRQISKGDLHDDCCESIYHTERTCGKSAVRKSFVLDCSDYRLKDPSQERIDEEKPEHFCDRVVHNVSFVISFYLMK